MDNFKSYEFTFLYLINKCILLFKYIDINNQKDIFSNIKLFVNKLQEIFSKADFKNSNDRKNKILEILINYFNNLIDEKIYYLLNKTSRDNIISEVEKKALDLCEKNDKSKSTHIIKENNVKEPSTYSDIEDKIDKKIKSAFSEIENNMKIVLKDYFEHTDYVEYDLDKKFNIKLETNNILIESKIKEYVKELIIKGNIHNDEIYDHVNKIIDKGF
jgi:hypothetical protein